MNINFYKIEDAQLYSYHYYSNQVSNNDLKELNGYKLRNILSVVFNNKTRDIFLENLFDRNGIFLSSQTRNNLFRYISIDERNDLKYYLSTYLDYQVNSGWYNNIIQLLNSESIDTIVFPTIILNHDLILAQLKSLFPKMKFVDWFGYDEKKKALILDYNDAWKRQNIFTIQESNSTAYFLKHFFESPYQWEAYNKDRHYFNCMNNKTRELIIGNEELAEVKEKLASLRPEKTLNKWDLLYEREHKYLLNPQEEINIYFTSTNYNNYRFSASFLLFKDGKYTIENANDLLRNTGKFEGIYEFSNLENIISQVDLSNLNKAIEKDISINQIIQPLWTKFNLNENDGRLWKQLLKRKVIEKGINVIFSEIEDISRVKQFVNLNTFENTYCNPENNTIIPRSKKVFKAICQYLELPLEYRAAIHRERNLTGENSQELHSKLKVFIKAIVEYGVLDNHKNDDQLLNIPNHIIDNFENCIDMDFFGFTRDALVYACIAICFEIIDKMKLKPIIQIEHVIPS